MADALLGFDARPVGPLIDEPWSPERRQRYLLRDVSRPLSVDHRVWWPSAFRHPREGTESSPLGWIPRPEWIGPNDLWDNLEQMESALDATPAPPRGIERVWKIALSWHENGELRLDRHGLYIEPMRPAAISATWECLGYDVADPTISGLSNCGYDPDERTALIPRWAPRLNEHHLFTQLDDAYAFRELTNQRVTEHAPFFVFGLWRIP